MVEKEHVPVIGDELVLSDDGWRREGDNNFDIYLDQYRSFSILQHETLVVDELLGNEQEIYDTLKYGGYYKSAVKLAGEILRRNNSADLYDMAVRVVGDSADQIAFRVFDGSDIMLHRDEISVLTECAKVHKGAYNSLFENVEDLQHGVADVRYELFRECSSALVVLLDSAPDEEKFEDVCSNVSKALHPDTLDEMRRSRFLASLLGCAGRAKEFGDRVVGAEIEAYGLDAEKCLDAWSQSASSRDDKPHVMETYVESVRRTLDTMREIERVRPGGVRMLSGEYGIFCFGRYPTSLLIDQIDMHGDRSAFDSVIAYPRADHNGAFSQNIMTLDRFFKRTRDMLNTRVIEFGDKLDIVRVLRRVEKHQGEFKLWFGHLGSHGVEKAFFPGDHELLGRVDVSDLEDGRVSVLQRYLADDFLLLMESCSTGAENGVGQKISEVYNCRVIAPDTACSLGSIVPEESVEGLDFRVSYIGDLGAEVKQMRYKSGVLQESFSKNSSK